jgi:hypothetical protein
VIYVASKDGQAPLIWVKWGSYDQPISLLYWLPYLDPFSTWTMSLNPILAWFLYFPHLVHGILGTILWYFLPRLLMPRKLGGVWGHHPQKMGPVAV